MKQSSRMTNRQDDTIQRSCLLRAKEYSQYLYELEEKRTERFQEATQTYLLFIGSTLAGTVGVLEWLNVRPVALLSSKISTQERVAIYILLLSLFALGVSFLLAILVIRVWYRERLCEPRDFLVDAAFAGNESELLEQIISNFIVASERNSIINDKRAGLLAVASQTYRLSLVLLTVATLVHIMQ